MKTKIKKLPKLSSKDAKYKATLTAEYYISRARKEKKKITNKKLQKLLYYAQAWNLVFNAKPLFKDELQAWVHGPAVPSIYHRYKKYGYSCITEDIGKDIEKQIGEKEKRVLDLVWKSYGKYPSNYLEILSHSELPWLEAREGVEPYVGSTKRISLDTMKKFYRDLLDKSRREFEQKTG